MVVSEPVGAPRKATPLQVVVAGVIGAVIFVLSLVLLVRLITG